MVEIGTSDGGANWWQKFELMSIPCDGGAIWWWKSELREWGRGVKPNGIITIMQKLVGSGDAD